uniref:Ubiquitin-like domain-containing protein n=1 Tax=Leersia perrieri TaxID=77586 RepID=A0A0D9W9L3_9ORYZ
MAAAVMHRSSSDGGSSSGWSEAAAAAAASGDERAGWEVRPSGMVVQAREDQLAAGAGAGIVGGAGIPPRPPPEIRVRVKYGGLRHEVAVSSVATFGELKKLLAARTGLQPADQKLTYKGKERNNSDYLDVCGVKNKSKLELAEDPNSVERRYIERQKNAKIETANRAIGAIALEVDKLADQVRSIEKSITRGSKVAEVQITTLIELLMRLAVKLDSIHAEGDSSSQKNIQAKRVQKCVETLDVLKISNARLQNVIVTTKWETFDSPATTQWELFD